MRKNVPVSQGKEMQKHFVCSCSRCVSQGKSEAFDIDVQRFKRNVGKEMDSFDTDAAPKKAPMILAVLAEEMAVSWSVLS